MPQTHGEILSISQTQKIGESFSKREIVVEVDQNTPYPQKILFELHQAHCSIADNLNEGDKVSVDYNLRGNQAKNKEGVLKTFNTLQAWKIQKV